MPKHKEWTPHQKKRLPDEGYWLLIYTGSRSYSSLHIYCNMNGKIKYIRQDVTDGRKHYPDPKWNTLSWVAMPTKKQIAKPRPEEDFVHFETWAELVKTHPSLEKEFKVKAPNDHIPYAPSKIIIRI